MSLEGGALYDAPAVFLTYFSVNGLHGGKACVDDTLGSLHYPWPSLCMCVCAMPQLPEHSVMQHVSMISTAHLMDKEWITALSK